MKPANQGAGNRALPVVLMLALGGLVVGIALQARSNRAAIADLEKRSRAQGEEAFGLRRQVESISEERAEALTSSRELGRKSEKLGADLAEATARAEKLAADLAAVRAERDEHLATRLDLSRRLDRTESAFAGEMAQARSYESELGDRIGALEAESARLRAEVARLAGEKAEVEAGARRERDAAAKAAAAAAEERKLLQAQLDALEGEFLAALEKARELGEARGVEMAARQAAEAARDDLLKQVAAATTALAAAEKARDEALAQLKALKEQIPPGDGGK